MGLLVVGSAIAGAFLQSGVCNLAWDPNRLRFSRLQDLPRDELTNYTTSINVGNVTAFTVRALNTKTDYFAVTAFYTLSQRQRASRLEVTLAVSQMHILLEPGYVSGGSTRKTRCPFALAIPISWSSLPWSNR